MKDDRQDIQQRTEQSHKYHLNKKIFFFIRFISVFVFRYFSIDVCLLINGAKLMFQHLLQYAMKENK